MIPPTDSRFRGDLRLFECGLIDNADEEKTRLEVKQRAARAERESLGIIFTPNFFDTIERISPVTS